MTQAIVTPAPVVLMIVDVQPNMPVSKVAYQEKVVLQIRDFADSVPHPKLNVGIAKSDALYASSPDIPEQERIDTINRNHRIALPIARSNEDIVIKKDPDTFSNPLVADYLKQRQTHTVLFVGGYSFGCVFASVEGAVRAGLNAKVMTDLIYEPPCTPNGRPFPPSNRKDRTRDLALLMEEWSPEMRDRVELTTSSKYLRSLNVEPVGRQENSTRPGWNVPIFNPQPSRA